ncbi:MAG: hypothetical protein Q7U53_14375 [Anaerolineaceae bacterium]|nr:hypothetical protein [Anaerolineaceae bacterium]
MINNNAAHITNHNQTAIVGLIVAAIIVFFYGIYLLINPMVNIEWSTETELDTYGFNLLREEAEKSSSASKINPQMIIARGSPIDGATYQYIDRDVLAGAFYTYHLQEVLLSNETEIIETIDVYVKYRGLMEIGVALVLFALAIYLSQQHKKSH